MFLRNIFTASLLCALILAATSSSAQVYEMRTYTANEGKLDALHARFRDHTVALFEKHGMQNIGYWVPVNEPESKNTLIYVIRHASPEAAKKSWASFMADPAWQEAYKNSIAEGKLVAKAESVYMNATDYSPKFESQEADEKAEYELRIYKTNPGKLDGLNARFRDHTLRLFERHGIQNVAYWTPVDEPESKNTLIYIIRHKSHDAAEASWKAFGADAEWKKVAEESQKDGKFLSERPQSTYMRASDYSPLK
jgi:hypothetical protein